MVIAPLGQPAGKDPYASLRSIASPAIVLVIRDRALFMNTTHEHERRKMRASPLDLFEQPASGFFSATC
jgi:hypothetical protein